MRNLGDREFGDLTERIAFPVAIDTNQADCNWPRREYDLPVSGLGKAQLVHDLFLSESSPTRQSALTFAILEDEVWENSTVRFLVERLRSPDSGLPTLSKSYAMQFDADDVALWVSVLHLSTCAYWGSITIDESTPFILVAGHEETIELLTPEEGLRTHFEKTCDSRGLRRLI
jgi:hypothetical protein